MKIREFADAYNVPAYLVLLEADRLGNEKLQYGFNAYLSKDNEEELRNTIADKYHITVFNLARQLSNEGIIIPWYRVLLIARRLKCENVAAGANCWLSKGEADEITSKLEHLLKPQANHNPHDEEVEA